MKEGEKVDSYLGRTLNVVNKMKSNGEAMEQSTCHKLGHFQYECLDWEKKANYAELKEEEELLLVVYEELHQIVQEEAWFLDSGYSNHMTGNKE
ncbi:hypothetical protein CR513_33799, partial [Mucuna pruriens]